MEHRWSERRRLHREAATALDATLEARAVFRSEPFGLRTVSCETCAAAMGDHHAVSRLTREPELDQLYGVRGVDAAADRAQRKLAEGLELGVR